MFICLKKGETISSLLNQVILGTGAKSTKFNLCYYRIVIRERTQFWLTANLNVKQNLLTRSKQPQKLNKDNKNVGLMSVS